MCTLKPPFDAQSLHFLAMKIVKGAIPPVSTSYSKPLRDLVTKLLTRDHEKRPNINQLLATPIMQSRITVFLDTNVLKEEFSHTMMHGQNLFALAEERKRKEKETKHLEVIKESSKEDQDTPIVHDDHSKKLQFD